MNGDDTTDREVRRFDPGALVVGLVYIGLAIYFLANRRISYSDVGVVVAVLLVGLGLAGVLRQRRT